MIRMRAVPDDFDNVQALHSPYGAVHALGQPVTPPGMDYGAASYGDNMMRPLMVDTIRRSESEDHMSPTGLSSAFGNVNFATSTGLANSDMHTPVSPASSERYYSHMSTPTGPGGQTSNPFGASPGMDASSQMQSRQQLRPSQPIQLRDTLQRSRSDSMQSPLRASMSWKGDAINYTTYPASSPGSGRQQSTYQPDSLRSSPSGGFGYDSGSFPGGSPTSMFA